MSPQHTLTVEKAGNFWTIHMDDDDATPPICQMIALTNDEFYALEKAIRGVRGG